MSTHVYDNEYGGGHVPQKLIGVRNAGGLYCFECHIPMYHRDDSNKLTQYNYCPMCRRTAHAAPLSIRNHKRFTENGRYRVGIGYCTVFTWFLKDWKKYVIGGRVYIESHGYQTLKQFKQFVEDCTYEKHAY